MSDWMHVTDGDFWLWPTRNYSNPAGGTTSSTDETETALAGYDEVVVDSVVVTSNTDTAGTLKLAGPETDVLHEVPIRAPAAGDNPVVPIGAKFRTLRMGAAGFHTGGFRANITSSGGTIAANVFFHAVGGVRTVTRLATASGSLLCDSASNQLCDSGSNRLLATGP